MHLHVRVLEHVSLTIDQVVMRSDLFDKVHKKWETCLFKCSATSSGTRGTCLAKHHGSPAAVDLLLRYSSGQFLVSNASRKLLVSGCWFCGNQHVAPGLGTGQEAVIDDILLMLTDLPWGWVTIKLGGWAEVRSAANLWSANQAQSLLYPV